MLIKKDLDFIFYVNNEKQAMELITNAYILHDQGDANVCLNVDKYKKYAGIKFRF